MMPYIKQEHRERLDPLIDTLALEISHIDYAYHPYESPLAGMLNYVITMLAHQLLPQQKYRVFALLIGALETCKLEMYRRLVAPYEDEKIEQHGDVY